MYGFSVIEGVLELELELVDTVIGPRSGRIRVRGAGCAGSLARLFS